MERKYRRCCGIDVHKKSVSVCVLAPTGKPETDIRRRTFRTFTRDLKQLRAWLKNCKVTEIAMESTGQYWRAVWNILEDHFEKLILVNPQHIKGLNGQKTDPKDAQWIASLLDSGKLKGTSTPQSHINKAILLWHKSGREAAHANAPNAELFVPTRPLFRSTH